LNAVVWADLAGVGGAEAARNTWMGFGARRSVAIR